MTKYLLLRHPETILQCCTPEAHPLGTTLQLCHPLKKFAKLQSAEIWGEVGYFDLLSPFNHAPTNRFQKRGCLRCQIIL